MMNNEAKWCVLIAAGVILAAVLLAYLIPAKIIEIQNENPPSTEVLVGDREVTAYTVGRPEETDDSPCIGAYGHDLCLLLEKGYTVFATNEFAEGTLLRVGDIEGIVLDRMNRRYGSRVDVAMKEYKNAIHFGRKQLQVSVIGTAIVER